MLWQLMAQQANLMACIDNFWLPGLAILAIVPFVFLMKKAKPGAAMVAHSRNPCQRPTLNLMDELNDKAV